MNWWLSQPSHATSEQVEISNLVENSGWLSNIVWSLDPDLNLVVNFEIYHLGKAICLSMTYPTFFPDVPPQIKPIDELKLSKHQYGSGGELCLEYRPDNWEPHVTGAMMIESAYRLITGENPTQGATARVESAHRSNLAQQVRREIYRVIISPDFITALGSLEESKTYPFALEEIFYGGNFIGIPKRIGLEESPIWEASPATYTIFKFGGFAIDLPDTLSPINETYEYLLKLSQSMGSQELIDVFNFSEKEIFVVFRCRNEIKVLSIPSGTGERKPKLYTNIYLPENQNRLPGNYTNLFDKSVAIVGCGSVGSKIAVSLARTGISKFVLIDGDLLFPGNLVRNELDARAIGLNKPDAVEARIQEVNPSASIQKMRMLLGGQESSTATNAALNMVSECDLIIDATANPTVFNFTALVAKSNKKPFIWGEIYGGGIGGLIARVRPDLDPPPNTARRQINKWCEDQHTTWVEGTTIDYGIDVDDAPPMIADDADVTVIAAHMTRFAIDVLVREESMFPTSAYLIGLQAKWIFNAPFDTYPIELTLEGSWGRDFDNSPELRYALLASLTPPTKTDENDAN